MSKSIKLKNNYFIDSKGIDYKHTDLETVIDNLMNKIRGTILFDGNATGNLTLNDDVSNYDYIEIYFYGVNNSNCNYVKVYNAENKNINLCCFSKRNLDASQVDYIAQIKVVKITGKNLSIGNNYTSMYGWNNAYPRVSQSNEVNITRIVGFKF